MVVSHGEMLNTRADGEYGNDRVGRGFGYSTVRTLYCCIVIATVHTVHRGLHVIVSTVLSKPCASAALRILVCIV